MAKKWDFFSKPVLLALYSANIYLLGRDSAGAGGSKATFPPYLPKPGESIEERAASRRAEFYRQYEKEKESDPGERNNKPVNKDVWLLGGYGDPEGLTDNYLYDDDEDDF